MNTIIGWLKSLGEWLITLPVLKHPRIRKVLIWLALIVLALLFFWMCKAIWGAMKPWARQIFVIALFALITLLWFLVGRQWLEKRRTNTRNVSGLSPLGTPLEAESANLMGQALSEAQLLMGRSANLDRRGSSLYSIPWMLVIGDATAPPESLLSCAAKASTFAPPTRTNATKQYWHWWFFKSMIAIECDPRFVCEPSDSATRGIWYQALELLRLNPERRRMPLNGIILTLSIERLLGDSETLHGHLLTLRRLVDECMLHLQVVVPVYLFVVASDNTPGYRNFIGILPPESLTQAVGHRFDYAPKNEAPSADAIEGIVAGLRDRMHQIRLAGIRRELDTNRRRGIWTLVEGFEGTLGSLKKAIAVLLENNNMQRTLALRGLYLVGVGARGAFLNDLFAKFLPTDQPLAERTPKPSVRRWGGAAISVALSAGLALLIATQILQAVKNNSNLRTIVASACDSLKPEAESDLHSLTSCSRQLVDIEARRRNATLTWGMDEHEPALKQKKKQVVGDFTQVLHEHDARLKSDIEQKKISVSHILSTAQRLWFIERCMQGVETCARVPDEAVLMFDSFSELFDAVRGFAMEEPSRHDVDSQNLIELYFAYLRWNGEVTAQENFLEQEKTLAQTALRRLLEIRPLTVQDIEQWSATHRAQRPAVSMAVFWGNIQDTKFAEVSSAFTKSTWSDIVQPVLEQARDAGMPKSNVDGFKKEYFARYFDAWRTFLAGFDKGIAAAINKQSSATFTSEVTKSGSPYHKLWMSVDQNLYSLPLAIGVDSRIAMWWDGMANDWTEMFGLTGRLIKNTYRRYTTLSTLAPPGWLEMLVHVHEAGWSDMYERIQPYYANLEADSDGVESSKLLGSLLTPDSKEFKTLDKISRIIQRADPRYKRGGKDDIPASKCHEGELKMLVTLIAQRAGKQIDTAWRGDEYPELTKMMANDPNAPIADRLRTFCARYTKLMVDCESGGPKEVIGVRAPLTKWFVNGVGKKLATPSAAAAPTATVGRIELQRPSTFGMIGEGRDGTKIELQCGESKMSVSSKGESRDELTLEIKKQPAPCTKVRIKVALPEVDKSMLTTAEGGAPPEDTTHSNLIKMYEGDRALFTLAEDFKSGAKSFDIVDLRSSYTDYDWERLSKQLKKMTIMQVRVFAKVKLEGGAESANGKPSSQGSIPESIID